MANVFEVESIINKAKKDGWSVCIYGTGRLGRNFGIELVELLGLKYDYVTDKNLLSLESFKCEQCKKITLNELKKKAEECLIIGCVGANYHNEIIKELSVNSNLHIIFLEDVVKLDSVIEKYFDIKLRKNDRNVAVYTCITGNYDVPQPLSVKDESCDYFVIGDNKYLDSDYEFIPVEDVVPRDIKDDKDRNRYCKMHGFSLFKNYDYSIYLDGNLKALRPLSECLRYIGDSGLAMIKHELYTSIFEEAIKMIANGKSDPESTKKLMQRYAHEGMPRDYGMHLGGLIVCDNRNKLGQLILEQWFEEYMTHHLRDLYSLSYILWKNRMPTSIIGTIEGGVSGKAGDYVMQMYVHKSKVDNC